MDILDVSCSLEEPFYKKKYFHNKEKNSNSTRFKELKSVIPISFSSQSSGKCGGINIGC